MLPIAPLVPRFGELVKNLAVFLESNSSEFPRTFDRQAELAQIGLDRPDTGAFASFCNSSSFQNSVLRENSKRSPCPNRY